MEKPPRVPLPIGWRVGDGVRRWRWRQRGEGAAGGGSGGVRGQLCPPPPPLFGDCGGCGGWHPRGTPVGTWVRSGGVRGRAVDDGGCVGGGRRGVLAEGGRFRGFFFRGVGASAPKRLVAPRLCQGTVRPWGCSMVRSPPGLQGTTGGWLLCRQPGGLQFRGERPPSPEPSPQVLPTVPSAGAGHCPPQRWRRHLPPEAGQWRAQVQGLVGGPGVPSVKMAEAASFREEVVSLHACAVGP